MSEELRFRVSAGLKDIIGRDLITDDFIAVFELVKNSFDAHATRVDIFFDDITNVNSRIRIIDDGKGMTYDDLIDKWLFVAYSAKKDGTEDSQSDYRYRLNGHRPYAGAKGIGRFSCDRLGEFLYLETTSEQNTEITEALYTDWSNFEGSLKEEFVNISVTHETKAQNSFEHTHGTMLEITKLRSSWDYDRLLRLKRSLAKLISPNIGGTEENFSIALHVPEIDDTSFLKSDQINGVIENDILEVLEYKTSYISVRLSEDGSLIHTELRDGGSLIYRITEKNRYSLLLNIRCFLIYLNQSAKSTFTRRMGIQPINYGHVFLYKNGFRIYPYGEPGSDPLKIDQRKTQGYGRYIGTRELIGKIEIIDNRDNFKETSSRGDGFVRNDYYFQLEDFLIEVLKRLERYVVDVQKWGLSFEENDTKERRQLIMELIEKISGSNDILDLEYDEQIISIIDAGQKNSAEAVVRNLTNMASKTDNEALKDLAMRASKKLEEIQVARVEAQSEAESAGKSLKIVEKELSVVARQNQLLKQATDPASVEIMSIEHHVNQAANRVDRNIRRIIQELGAVTIDVENVKKYLIRISLENKKMSSLINYVRKARFDTMSAQITSDLVEYISEYIENIYKEDDIRVINKEIVPNIKSVYESGMNFIMEFKPLEVNIIIDNLLDNSFKAKANNVQVVFHKISGECLQIDYYDDGHGIGKELKNQIFELGYTTTGGTGIGLYHVSELLRNIYKGNVELLDDVDRGTHFRLIINK